MFYPHTDAEVSRSRTMFPLILLLIALHTPLSVAVGNTGDSPPVPILTGRIPPSESLMADRDRHLEPADHVGHGLEAAGPGPGVESDHDHEASPQNHDDRQEQDEEACTRPSALYQGAHDHEEATGIHLSPEQRRTLDLEISVLEPQRLGETLRAPGEVRLNAYATAQVTPRITAQVTDRHARLGESVEPGQPLVTLSSVAMAEAQGDLVVAEREWQRLTKLKGQFISESDYLEASVSRQKTLSRVLAYGMTRPQADALVSGASELADGSFELLAPRSGTLIRDQFVLGELVEPGDVLFEITDESVRWVEARMPPEEVARVLVGDRARVAYRNSWLDGQVTQIHHLLDKATRTQAVRIEVPDPAHQLHPGVFVDVVILAGDGKPVLALPEAAVLRSPDGDWQVFVTDGEDAFKPVEVEMLSTPGGMALINGLPAGTRVVTRGAFFLQSELAKSGFDPHNH